MSSQLAAGTRTPLLAIDKIARKALMPYRRSAPIKVISKLSELGDQPQLRMLSGGMIALGLLRADGHMVRAGAHMLVAHELATFVKNFVKLRVDRKRPRSASPNDQQEPRPGRSKRKEDTSFPSGHSAGSMAVALAYSHSYPEHRTTALAIASAISVAQVPRCAHYPTDVAAGMVIGATSEGALRLAGRAVRAMLRPKHIPTWKQETL
jgi:undecaprenyl-diphosphatase